MSYRRRPRDKAWSAWLSENRAFLLEHCGLSEVVLESEGAWLHFLDHGFAWPPRPESFSVSWLNAEQKRNLLRFLQRESRADSSLAAHLRPSLK